MMSWRKCVSLLEERWWLVALSLLVVGLIARFVSSVLDSFEGDNYWLMYNVDKPFWEYAKSTSFGLQLVIHYWLSYRVLGNNLWGYMIPSLLSSLALLLVVYWGMRHFWPSKPVMSIVTIGILAFNCFSLYYSRYAMIAYAFTFLVWGCLFFVFLRLCDAKLTRKQSICMAVLLVPAGFLVTDTLAAPICAGIVSVFAVRWWQSRMSLDLAKVQGHLFEMWPLVPLLAVKVATFLASPTHLVGAGMRLLTGPYHDQWFFWRSEYSHTIWGAISFVSDRTARLFKGLLEPGFSPDTADMRVLWILVLIVMAIVWIVLAIRMMQRRLDAKMSFLVVFTAVSLTGIAVGGLLGLYPYGRNRYAYFLLLPMTILLGYAISSLVGWGMAKVPRIQPLAQSRALPVMIAVVVLASGIAYNVHQCRHHLTITNENQTALREIGGTSADLVLVSGYGRVFVKPMYPDLYARAYDMGMGKSGSGFVREPDESVPTEVARVITGTDGVLEDTLLVVDVSMDHWLDEYPSWAELVVEQFDMSSEIVAPDIWSGCYTRKQA